MSATSTSTASAPSPAPRPASSPLRSFLSGASGGISVVLVSHPFDLCKVLMQTANLKATSGAAPPTTTMAMMKQIMKTSGVRGLYRGVGPVLVGTPPVLATCFYSYHAALTFLDGHPTSSATSPNWGAIALAGAFSAVPTTLLLAPAEQIKIRLQIQTPTPNAQGSTASLSRPPQQSTLTIIRQIIHQSGVQGLFRGTLITLSRDVPGSAAYFACYEYIKHTLTLPSPAPPTTTTTSTGLSSWQHNPYFLKLHNVAVILLAGGLSGFANWSIALPFDTLKSRYQSSNEKSLREVWRTVWGSGGMDGCRRLYAGLGPTMMRAFPASAAFFGGVEAFAFVWNWMGM